ncbi:MAG: serine hydroxymethyltransferase [Boseongicola sp. SB0664_bin_43]|uniref:2-methylserine hydroxymethyltransferase n=1 Tax=Boseongicola sp. SB0664_bin_43 TaxID=2604844 RepID=A0A6B0XZY0_9RHOB|nr:serine hydroxymethyltransferase [Boseongicola sp. SB0664_bin_43]
MTGNSRKGGDPAGHVSRSLADSDPEVCKALDDETCRQHAQIELIASENIMSRAVREALGHEIGNKTLEGYPGNRFHGGGEHVDVVERLAIKRAATLFGAAYVNVQPHSGTQANQAVLYAFLRPGDRILSLDLAAGGHLSHGARANLSGRWFDSRSYGVDRETGLLDYDEIEACARELRPALLIAGGSAYPRAIDFERMARIAEACEARLLVDMAHIAGLVAAGVHASPLPHADVVTCTTTKTLRGPRGGIILSRSEEFARQFQSAVFPGVQGSLHSNVLAAKAVCLGEALRPEFRDYGMQVVANARTLAATLAGCGIGIIGGGTDTHMVLLDLASVGLLGSQAEAALARAGITSNRNPVPFDARNPSKWTGLRLGVSAATTRGLESTDMEVLGTCIAELLHAEARSDPGPALARTKSRILRLAQCPGRNDGTASERCRSTRSGGERVA